MKHLARFAAVLAFLPLLLLTVGTGPVHAMEPDGTFNVYAHRGYKDGTVTENTIRALNNAYRHGARAAEVDLVLTKDHQFLLMHDETLGRTTNCTGKVAHRTLSDIQQNCRGEYNGERLVTANVAVRWAARRNVRLILEIKPHGDWTEGHFHRLSRVINRNDMANKVLLHSFSRRHLITAEDADRNLHTQYITQNWEDVSYVRDWVDGVNVSLGHLTRERVATLHADGLLVLVRHTDSPQGFNRARNLGTDGLVTNEVAMAVRRVQHPR